MTDIIFKKIQSSAIIQVLIIIAFGIYILPQIEERAARLIAYGICVICTSLILYTSYAIKDITTNLDYNPRFYKLNLRENLEVKLLKHGIYTTVFVGFILLIFYVFDFDKYTIGARYTYLTIAFTVIIFQEKHLFLRHYFKHYENINQIYEVKEGQKLKTMVDYTVLLVKLLVVLFIVFMFIQ